MAKQERTQLNCETTAITDFLTEELGVKSYSPLSVSQKIVMVHFHIMRRSNGTGGLSSAQVDQVLELLQIAMEQASICIAERGRSFVDNTTFYDSNPSVTFSSIVATNRQSNAINLYLFPTTSTLFGRADGIPSNALVVSGSYVLTGVVTHELGHCLGLFHTHRGTFFEGGGPQCAELVNGSNSAVCGDYVTDTPADPNIWSGCTYIGTVTDANGQPYSPLTDNIMSYVSPSCLQSFTPLQIARMHTAIDNSTVLQNVMPSISGSDVICTSAVYTLVNIPFGASITWSAIPSNALTISGSGSSVTVTTTVNFINEATLVASIEGVCGTTTTVLEKVLSKQIINITAITAFNEYGQSGKLCRFSANNYYEIFTNPYLTGVTYEVQIRHWPTLLTVYTTTTIYPITPLPYNFTSEGEFEIRTRVINHACATGDWTSSLFEYLDDCISSYWNVSPNPVNETLSISIGNENVEDQNLQRTSSQSFSVILYDPTGKSVANGESDNGKLSLDTSSLLEGNYLLHIYNEDGTTAEKRVVLIER